MLRWSRERNSEKGCNHAFEHPTHKYSLNLGHDEYRCFICIQQWWEHNYTFNTCILCNKCSDKGKCIFKFIVTKRKILHKYNTQKEEHTERIKCTYILKVFFSSYNSMQTTIIVYTFFFTRVFLLSQVHNSSTYYLGNEFCMPGHLLICFVCLLVS